MSSSPNFLVIGAQRAGTSWLWWQLREHPDIWMPPVKELHYFDRSRSYHSPSHLATRTGVGGLLGRGTDAAKFRRRFLRRLRSDVSEWELLRWNLGYFLGPRHDDWYVSLFASGEGKVRGEATPAYAILGAHDVERVVELLPDVRIVFILRNPVDRAWSHVRHEFEPRIRAGTITVAEMCRFIDGPRQSLRSDYLRTIEIWSQHLPEGRLHVGFYDHLVADPKRFFEGVCEFLGAAPARIDPAKLRLGPLGVGPDVAMPAELRRHLARKYREPIARLSDAHGDPPAQWLSQTDAALEGAAA